MLTKLLAATKRAKRQTTSGIARRRALRPEQLEDRRLLAVFQGLGDLAGGDVVSFAYRVSNDGQVVVGESSTEAGPQPFRWSAGEGMAALDTVGETNGVARAVSGDGSVVVGYAHPFQAAGLPSQAFRWENGLSSEIVGPGSSALAMTPDAEFIAGTQEGDSGEDVAYLLRQATGEVTSLGQLVPGRASVPRGVSDDGSIVAGYVFDDATRYAFRWDSQNGLQTIVGDSGSNVDISGDGLTIVGGTRIIDKVSGKGRILSSHTEAFRWTDQSGSSAIDFLGDLPGGDEYSSASAVSGDGSVIVGTSSSAARREEAFIWDEDNGMRSLQDVLANQYGLDLTGWQLREVRDVTADGTTFVGYGLNPDGFLEAFIASLGPPAAGVSVSPVSGMETTEGGGTSSFEVVLDTQPTSDVTIAISSSDTTEGVVDKSSVVFTTSNWNVPQTVTISGVDDADEDGDIAFQIVTSAATSTDANYDGLDVSDVAVTNLDDDGIVSNAIYVGSIDFESRRGGQDWRAVFEVFVDSNQNGLADTSDATAAGADITVSFNGKTFTGIIGSDGLFHTNWQRKLASGQYEAEVVDLALADYRWDLTIGWEDSDDEDYLPDATLVL